MKFLSAGIRLFENPQPRESDNLILIDQQLAGLSQSTSGQNHLNLFHGEFVLRLLREFEQLKERSRPVTEVIETVAEAYGFEKAQVPKPPHSFAEKVVEWIEGRLEACGSAWRNHSVETRSMSGVK